MTRIIVTGATGRIGRVVVSELLERGYSVRATTSKEPPASEDRGDAPEWRRFDFSEATDYDGLVAGCDVVLHIGAELNDPGRMWRTNVEATGLLAEAAERAGVKAFCYVSSISVYGSGLTRVMTEDAPVLTVDQDIRSEFWSGEHWRTYGRTKLGGERALQRAAKAVRYVVMRPASVVDVPQVLAVRDWSRLRKAIAAHRHAHHVYIRDVSDAIIWAAERALAGAGAPGSIEIFNLSEDDFPEPTYADFMRNAFAATGDARFRTPVVPWVADWLLEFARARTFPLRNPRWRMLFPNDRLRAAGYRFPFGMAQLHTLALEALHREAGRPADGRQLFARG